MAKPKKPKVSKVKTEKVVARPPGERYIKHLIECKCILPQYKKLTNPIYHKFIVFSEIEETTGSVVKSYTQCPVCGAVHRVNEIGLSKILNKDSMLTLPTIEDIKLNLPGGIAAVLERHECDLPTWQEAEFIIKNKLWGKTLILAKDREGTEVIGKYVIILSPTLHKVEVFEMNDGTFKI